MPFPSIVRLPSIKQGYKHVVTFATGRSLCGIGIGLSRLVLTVLVAKAAGPTVAGWYFGLGAALQIVLAIPLGGYLADRLSSLRVVRLYLGSFIVAGLIWLLGGNTLHTYILLAPFFFFGYGLEVAGKSYLLQTTDTDNGGTVFGLFASIIALGSLASTLIFPYFSVNPFPAVPIIFLITSLLFLYFTFQLPKDKVLRTDPIRLQDVYTLFFKELKEAVHFIKTNSYVPLLVVGDALFEGVFYAAIWFLIPLEVMQYTAGSGVLKGLGVGIYELITILSAGRVGYMADRYNWRVITVLGWAVILLGLMGMYVWHSAVGLVVFGAVIALGNNAEYGAGYHALEKYDIDHPEDGAFGSLLVITKAIGYLVVPIVMGVVYSAHGLTGSISALLLLVGVIAVVMMLAVNKLRIAS